MCCAGFTGIDQDYEAPQDPELVLRAGDLSIDECVQQLVQLLQKKVRHVTCSAVIGNDFDKRTAVDCLATRIQRAKSESSFFYDISLERNNNLSV